MFKTHSLTCNVILKTIHLPINKNHLETTLGRDECVQLLCNTASFLTAGHLVRSSRLLRIMGKRSMKGRRGPDQGKIAWLSDRMCLVTHSVFLLGPRQPSKATHEKKRGRLQDMRLLLCEHVLVYVFAWVCVNAWRKERYIVSVFSLERLWYASEMPTAVTASSTKCISGKHTQMHTNAHRLPPSHLRKTLQMCLENCSTLGGKALSFFSFFVPNEQTATDFPTSLHQVMTPS